MKSKKTVLPELSKQIARNGFVLIAMIFLSIAVTSGFVVWKTYKRQMNESHLVLVGSVSRAIEEYLNQPKSQLETVMRVWNSLPSDSARIKFLHQVVHENPSFIRVQILDEKGIVVQTFPESADLIGLDMSAQDYFKKTLTSNRPYWSSVFFSASENEATAAYSIPISLKNGKVLTAYLSLRRLADFELPKEFSKGSQLIVTDQKGLYLIHPNINKVLQREVFPEYDVVVKAMGNDRTIQMELNSGDNAYFCTGYFVDPYQWGVFILQPKSVLFKPVFDLFKRLSILSLVFSILTLWLSYIAFRSAFVPLNEIIAKMQLLGSGKSNNKLEEPQFREFENITRQFNTMSEQINLRERALSSKNQELENMLYISSHDLRTPLVNILGYSSELKDMVKHLQQEAPENSSCSELLKKDIPEAMRFISESTLRMDQLLKGLTKIGRLNRNEILATNVDLTRLMHKIQDDMGYVFKKANVQFDFVSLPVVRGDLTEIQQIFTNLFENAIKYAKKNESPHIVVSCKNLEESTEIYIQDNGIGINENNLSKVFNIFYRVGDMNEVSGEGLGLTIVQRLIERQQGFIRVESQIGKGTTFIVTLPIANDQMNA